MKMKKVVKDVTSKENKSAKAEIKEAWRKKSLGKLMRKEGRKSMSLLRRNQRIPP